MPLIKTSTNTATTTTATTIAAATAVVAEAGAATSSLATATTTLDEMKTSTATTPHYKATKNTANPPTDSAKTTATTTTNHSKLDTKRNRHRHHSNNNNNTSNSNRKHHKTSLAKSVPATPVQVNPTTNQFVPSSTDYNDDDDDDDEPVYNDGLLYMPPYSYPHCSIDHNQHHNHNLQHHRNEFQQELHEGEIFREVCSDQHPLELAHDLEDDSSSLAMITPPPPYDTPYSKQHHQQHPQHSAPQHSNYSASSYASAKSRSDMPPQARKYLFNNRETFTISSSNGNSSSNSIHQQPMQSTSLAGTLTNAITPTKLSAAAAAMFAAPQMVHLNRKWSNLHRKRRRRNSSSGDSKELDKLVLQSVDWDENDIY